ncbi:hypothetical protein COOONC_13442 [Cooperia oncophora]
MEDIAAVSKIYFTGPPVGQQPVVLMKAAIPAQENVEKGDSRHLRRTSPKLFPALLEFTGEGYLREVKEGELDIDFDSLE